MSPIIRLVSSSDALMAIITVGESWEGSVNSVSKIGVMCTSAV